MLSLLINTGWFHGRIRA